MRIGLISDTHETEHPLMLVEQLRRLSCDYNIHLGDIGGSWSSSQLVRRFKEDGRILDTLSAPRRARYDALVQAGTREVLAWLQVTVGDDPEGARRRRRETAESYDAIIGAMKSLPNAIFLGGNVEHIAGRGEMVRQAIARHRVDYLDTPQVRLAHGTALLLWPSPENRRQETGALVALAERLRGLVRGCSPVLILTHEQMFKGPVPAVYRAGVEATGRPAGSIPYYEPNPQRLAMLRLLRGLPPDTVMGVVHGHTHDGNEILMAGAPYLGPQDEQGLRLRLYGLGGGCDEPGQRGTERQAFGSFCVAAGRLAVLTVEDGGYRVENIPSG